MFLHCFQKCRLRFRCRTVDFVGENNVTENRAGLKIKGGISFLILYDDICTRNVCRHEVRGELDTRERKIKYPTEGADKSCFTDTGNAFEKDVAARDHSDDSAFHNFVLADNVAPDLCKDIFALFAELLNVLLCNHDFSDPL